MTVKFLRFGALAAAALSVACTATINDTGDDSGAGPGPGVGPGPGGGGSSSTGGNGSGGGATLPPNVTGKLKLDGNPSYYRVVRLTNQQWSKSVQNVFGLSSPPSQAERLQDAVSGTTDFTNNELVLGVDSRAWSDYQDAAEELAKQITADSAALSKLYSGTDAAGFISTVGRRFYKRPLTPAEVSAYQALFDKGATLTGSLSGFAKGAGLVLRAMLQSPHFLYRTELGAVGAPLSGYEMAAKLSLWLRDTVPDDALLDAAAGPGKLDTVEGAVEAATKMLDDPAAKAMMRKFHGEFLHFDRFNNLSKVGVDDYDPSINAELQESSYLFFDKIFSQGLGVKDVFLSKSGFVGPKMSALLGGGPAGSGFVERELDAKRVGYFMQLPFLVLYAHNDDPDPIHRGVSMSLDVLCSRLGPPAAVIPPLPTRMPGQTNRVVVDEHTKGCGAACHNNMINPLGFAFENFDGMGRYRETETYGNEVLPVDASGSFEFVEGTKSYNNAAELMSVLSTDEQAHLCYSKKLASYGLQRDVVENDGSLLQALAAKSNASGSSLKQVMIELVKQDAFRTRSGGAK